MNEPTPAPVPPGSARPAELVASGEPVAAASPVPHPGRSVPWPPKADQRGLAAPYPPGGVDPEPDAGRREERFYLRLLLAMVLLIVVGGFAISLIGLLVGFAGGGE